MHRECKAKRRRKAGARRESSAQRPGLHRKPWEPEGPDECDQQDSNQAGGGGHPAGRLEHFLPGSDRHIATPSVPDLRPNSGCIAPFLLSPRMVFWWPSELLSPDCAGHPGLSTTELPPDFRPRGSHPPERHDPCSIATLRIILARYR